MLLKHWLPFWALFHHVILLDLCELLITFSLAHVILLLLFLTEVIDVVIRHENYIICIVGIVVDLNTLMRYRFVEASLFDACIVLVYIILKAILLDLWVRLILCWFPFPKRRIVFVLGIRFWLDSNTEVVFWIDGWRIISKTAISLLKIRKLAPFLKTLRFSSKYIYISNDIIRRTLQSCLY